MMGGYSCIVKGPADLLAGDAGAAPADLLLVALHGLGASNTDLCDIDTMLGQFQPQLAGARVVLVAPQAPSGPMGPAWWSFEVQKCARRASKVPRTLFVHIRSRMAPSAATCARSFMAA